MQSHKATPELVGKAPQKTQRAWLKSLIGDVEEEEHASVLPSRKKNMHLSCCRTRCLTDLPREPLSKKWRKRSSARPDSRQITVRRCTTKLHCVRSH